MAQTFKHFAVRTVKPHVSPDAWQLMRHPRAALPSIRARRSAQRVLARMNLNELAEHFKTDKWGAHRYTQHYQRHLEQWRHDAFTFLEIGIGGYAHQGKGGGSLRMWKQFFPKAQIVGLDIEDKSFVAEDRIRVYQGSQADPDVLHRIVADAGSIRVILDDGSHNPAHIRETFRILFPLLEPHGIYIIEDTQTSYWPQWGGSEDLDDPSTTMALVKGLVDGINYEEYVDEAYEPTYTDRHVVGVHVYHNLVIIEKGENAEGTKRRFLLRKTYAEAAAAKAAAVQTAAVQTAAVQAAAVPPATEPN